MMIRLSSILLALLLMASVAPSRLAAAPRDNVEPLVDSPMDFDPELSAIPPAPVFDKNLAATWRWALDEPDAETRRRAADAIATAHRNGMQGLDAFVPKLVEQISAPDQQRYVRLAAANALIELNARDAASALLQRNQQDGVDMVLATDAALAAWRYAPANDVWLKRISDSRELIAVRISALHAAARAQAPAAERARTIVLDKDADETLRLAAVDALATLSPSGLESTAQRFDTPQASPLERLLAAKLLAHHQGAPAMALMLTLAQDAEPAVARVALARLTKLDPLAIKAIAPKLLASPDVEVRRLTAGAVAAQRSPEAVAALVPLLDDADYSIRRGVRDLLLSLDKETSLKAVLRDTATRGSRSESWKTQEQSILLLGKLDHKPAAPALLALIDHKRPEVRLAAVASLRWLAVPESLPALLKHAQSLADGVEAIGTATSMANKQANDLLKSVQENHDPRGHKDRPPPLQPRLLARGLGDTDRELSQVFQMFGAMRYSPAEDLMRRHVPKHSFPWSTARTAAIWSLGYLHEGKPDDGLAAQFASRAGDNNPLDPEAMNVRQMSAVSIGRMKATSMLGSMQALNKSLDAEAVILASRWAIIQITGKEIPLPAAQPSVQSGWFLEPVN